MTRSPDRQAILTVMRGHRMKHLLLAAVIWMALDTAYNIGRAAGVHYALQIVKAYVAGAESQRVS